MSILIDVFAVIHTGPEDGSMKGTGSAGSGV